VPKRRGRRVLSEGSADSARKPFTGAAGRPNFAGGRRKKCGRLLSDRLNRIQVRKELGMGYPVTAGAPGGGKTNAYAGKFVRGCAV